MSAVRRHGGTELSSKQFGVGVLVLFAVTAGCTMLHADPATRGQRDAKRDIRNGRTVYKVTHGRPAPWRRDFLDALKSEYGIESELVINDTDYARGYNDTMRSEIVREFGTDVISIAAHRAISEYRSDADVHKKGDGDEP